MVAILMMVAHLGVATADLHCTVTNSTCFADFVDGKTRILAGDYFTTSSTQTKESCADECRTAGFRTAAVEDGGECHCGTGGFTSKPTMLPDSKCTTPCTGAAGETCGGIDALEVLSFTCTGTVTPNYKGCETALSKAQKYCDTSLTIDERIESMFANLTLDEKIGMISPQRRCVGHSQDHSVASHMRIGCGLFLVGCFNASSHSHTTPVAICLLISYLGTGTGATHVVTTLAGRTRLGLATTSGWWRLTRMWRPSATPTPSTHARRHSSGRWAWGHPSTARAGI